MCRGENKRKGIALIVCIAFLAIFSALAVGMAGMADNNVQLGRNQHQASAALTGAQSGLEIMRYWLKGIEVPNTSDTSVKMSKVASKLQTKLTAAGVTTIVPVYDASTNTISIPITSLDSATGEKFQVKISALNADTVQAQITGGCGAASKQVNVNFGFTVLGSSIWDNGIATRGSLSLSGQSNVGSSELAIYASVYIEGIGCIGDDLSMTNNTSIAGDVSIADPYATVAVGGGATIGGASGSNADEHIHIGVPKIPFPTPDPEHFLQYANPASEITSTSTGPFNNCIIRANTNPTFASDVEINGVLYIEQPNKVQFAGKVTLNGVIAAAGDLTEHDGTSSLKFAGQVVSNDVSTLPDTPEYQGIRNDTGTAICAPGFQLDFTGQSLLMNGVVAGNGINFSGQSGGTINGSIIDYSLDGMMMVGQSSLIFNRSGRDSVPAGFEPVEMLDFVPNSYSETL